MTIRLAITLLTTLALCACNRPAENRTEPSTVAGVNDAAPASAATSDTNIALPDDRAPLEEPKGPIDSRSAEAAGQVVQHYAALIEQDHWKESWTLWSDPVAAKEFDLNWRGDTEVHMEIGKPGDIEGAAGSSYVTVPGIFYGKTTAGADFRRAADIVLRRVNDVPGSTEAQRRWHIDRVIWKTAS